MSREQRIRVDEILRQPGAGGSRAVEELRSGFRQLMAQMIVPHSSIRTAPTTLGDRPALRVEPRRASDRGADAGPDAGTILYFHGGGWVFGSPETALSLTGNLVARTGLAAYSLDYRLAPEHPFPAAIEDGLSAYRALLDRGEDPSAIVVAGDSAGGGLAVTTCLAARDAGLPLPAALLAFSPGTDATRTGASMDTKEDIDPIFTRAALEHTGAMHLAGADPRQPLLSPAVHADLTGLPPMLIQVGTNEMLLDDSTRLAARASAAGVDVILDVTADVPHVFQSFAGVLDEADEALDRAALFLRQRIRGGGGPRTSVG
ncbi:alpha/beta hydrolase [Streptomyces noursei ZPM]|uniref:Alpha/beta hydrolase n=1 Tax=Streptomyces noursei TaxID=1971 RepID=A0A401QSL8_STRNR|nr:alpha/beta hydrolase [Streptomyces noursei]AKA01344.1 alpha/beta hydrolase [Streptomyces noursei ZPM]EOT02936.2 alpha/beta hydrolase [Streptomyces noursei CCRC 11814]EXU92316.1 alpha/beta hydrolase [Streptomyces noursei PD-1]GCB88355.1 alpha/beta hydrolase [Streptomyces noursei]